MAWQQAAASPQPAVRLARIAVTHLVEVEFDAARRAYKEALASDPKLFEALYGLAVLEQDAGNTPAALEAALAAESNAPGDTARAAAQAIAGWVRPYAEVRLSPGMSR